MKNNLKDATLSFLPVGVKDLYFSQLISLWDPEQSGEFESQDGMNANLALEKEALEDDLPSIQFSVACSMFRYSLRRTIKSFVVGNIVLRYSSSKMYEF